MIFDNKRDAIEHLQKILDEDFAHTRQKNIYQKQHVDKLHIVDK